MTAILIVAGIGLLVVLVLVLLPSGLRWIIRRRGGPLVTQPWHEGVAGHYDSHTFYYWMFARCKLRMDPMFSELPAFLETSRSIRHAVDIGCGCGVPGCLLLELHGDAHIHGLEPNARRARAAARAFGPRGQVHRGRAPTDLPEFPQPAQLVMAIDMIQYLPDEELARLLRRLHAQMADGGRLIMRVLLPRPEAAGWEWRINVVGAWLRRVRLYLRPLDTFETILARHGFVVERAEFSGHTHTLGWLVGRAVHAPLTVRDHKAAPAVSAVPAE